MEIMRTEYPRPQFQREDWLNLNGEWNFLIDNEKMGEYRKFYEEANYDLKINVPFCPESKLSGIEHKEFMYCVWYNRQFDLSEKQASGSVIINFGAVDYHSVLYINKKKVGEHKGGYSSFSFDISEFVSVGSNDITLCVYDDTRSGNQPCGKQSDRPDSYGCFYTRTTGIWQTVWLDFTGKAHICSVNYKTDFNHVNICAKLNQKAIGCTLKASAYWEGKLVGSGETTVTSVSENLIFDLSETHLWDLGKGNLYDVKLELTDGNSVSDSVMSYFGIRTVSLDGMAFLLNGRKVFGRWVLDQGFYPDGIYTAPTEEDLKQDIIKSMELGFNGARLHEKVFEPRFLYWADKLGYMVWGEQANWGYRITELSQIEHFLPEWLEVLERDMSHPSIIGWIPFNETWDWQNKIPQNDMLLELIYKTTKAVDGTRPVIDTSGNFHVITDIFDVHDYEQDVEKFKACYTDIKSGVVNDQIARNPKLAHKQKYNGEPVFMSEYGGIKWTKSTNGDSWGYGKGPQTEEEFIERYKGLTNAMLDNPNIMGFCYTQLYDVEQEQNGLMTYEREFKFEPKVFFDINTKKAEIEK